MRQQAACSKVDGLLQQIADLQNDVSSLQVTHQTNALPLYVSNHLSMSPLMMTFRITLHVTCESGHDTTMHALQCICLHILNSYCLAGCHTQVHVTKQDIVEHHCPLPP